MISTIGNHDFDNGIQGLYAQMPHAKFEFVSANYDFKYCNEWFSETLQDFNKKRY
jgi:2',3'-cyclic-nucleotide 2'-phosphodiesterase (5'-nucleotidase family)